MANKVRELTESEIKSLQKIQSQIDYLNLVNSRISECIARYNGLKGSGLKLIARVDEIIRGLNDDRLDVEFGIQRELPLDE